jgi:purine-nucleoside phosphorylase
VSDSALSIVKAYEPDAAVIFGSGLAALPDGSTVDDEVLYSDLGWPCTAVPGHANRLQLVRLRGAGRRSLRLALACGRPHGYEGFTADELEYPVRTLAAGGVRRLVLTNSTGALRAAVEPRDVVVGVAVVDLQGAPTQAEPSRLEVCTAAEAAAVADALAPNAVFTGFSQRARAGVYVAVCGPQFETAAEVAWLGRYGDVVGMSAAPEVRAARSSGVQCCLLALVVNRAAEVSSHDDVLASGSGLASTLAAGLGAAIAARWPGVM